MTRNIEQKLEDLYNRWNLKRHKNVNISKRLNELKELS